MAERARRTSRGEVVLEDRALGRATLARQLLLARERLPLLKAIEGLGPLQAQLPRPPFLALQARLANFDRSGLLRLLQERKVVRGTLMRGTLHLVSARDYLRFRPVLSEALAAAGRGMLEARSKEMTFETAAAAARPLFLAKPRSFDDVRAHLLKRFPRADVRALGYAARMGLPLLQVPGEGGWGFPSVADFVHAETWLGEAVAEEGKADELVLSYLGAFGPASVADAQGFLGLPGLQGVFEGLRARLVTFRDARGRELFDRPEAPRPADAPAAPRLLPDFDSLILAHADRSRFVADEHRRALATRNLRIPPTVLVDGRVAGTWDAAKKRGTASLLVRTFGALARPDRAALEQEGEALLRFAEPSARGFEVRFGGA